MNYSVPKNQTEANARLHVLLVNRSSLHTVPRPVFSDGWAALAYLHPGLHPDAVGDPDGSWPEDLQSIGMEAWRRYEAGELSEDELYPADTQWAGIFDQRENPTEEETRRRRLLSDITPKL